jgi:thiol-disulfide isomerase/thioredoxin
MVHSTYIIPFFIAIALDASAQVSNSGVAEGQGVKFQQQLSLNEIKAKAKEEGKYIFMDAFATWCGPCKQMEREVYPNDSVGAEMNKNFISIKVQMDSSDKDDAAVRKWYADARKIREEFGIVAYPTLLFLTPDGQLVYKQLGYNGIPEFMRAVRAAVSPMNTVYFSQLEHYKAKSGPYTVSDSLARYAALLGQNAVAQRIAEEFIESLPRESLESEEKIFFVWGIARNKPMADSLFLLYKENYLNRLSDAEFCTKANLSFVARFSKLMVSADRFFRLCYEEPATVDSMMQVSHGAVVYVDSTIAREELASRVFSPGLPKGQQPDWSELESGIKVKYPKANAHLIILDFEMKYYKAKKDWEKYCSLLVERVDAYGPFGQIDDADFNLNNLAWDVFQHSYDKKVLQAALSWSNRAVRIVEDSKNHGNLGNWMDTNANIRYKLGDRKQAIEEEKKAIELDTQAPDLKNNLAKMNAGKPTWIEN